MTPSGLLQRGRRGVCVCRRTGNPVLRRQGSLLTHGYGSGWEYSPGVDMGRSRVSIHVYLPQVCEIGRSVVTCLTGKDCGDSSTHHLFGNRPVVPRTHRHLFNGWERPGTKRLIFHSPNLTPSGDETPCFRRKVGRSSARTEGTRRRFR